MLRGGNRRLLARGSLPSRNRLLPSVLPGDLRLPMFPLVNRLPVFPREKFGCFLRDFFHTTVKTYSNLDVPEQKGVGNFEMVTSDSPLMGQLLLLPHHTESVFLTIYLCALNYGL